MPNIEQLMEWGKAIVPLLPYIATIFVTYKFMDSVVKPILRARRDPKTKQFRSKAWWAIRRGMMFYPGVVGLLTGLAYNAARPDDMPAGNMFWFGLCGMSSQWLVDAGRDWAKSKGMNVPTLRDTLSSPPPEA